MITTGDSRGLLLVELRPSSDRYGMYIDDLPVWAFLGQPGSGAGALLEGSGGSRKWW